MTWQCCTMCTRPQAAAGPDGSMRGGAASSTGFMMLLDPDMPAGLLDEATAALLDPGHVPGNEGSPLGLSTCEGPTTVVCNAPRMCLDSAAMFATTLKRCSGSCECCHGIRGPVSRGCLSQGWCCASLLATH